MTSIAWPNPVSATTISEDIFGPKSSPTTTPGADPTLLVNEQELKKTIRLLTEETSLDDNEPRNWSVALRLLLAWLTGLRYEEAAVIVGIPPDNLTRILHGDLRLQQSRHRRIDRMLNLMVALRTLLDAGDVATWFRGEIPALKGDSPIEAARKGKIDNLERVVSSYFDTRYA